LIIIVGTEPSECVVVVVVHTEVVYGREQSLNDQMHRRIECVEKKYHHWNELPRKPRQILPLFKKNYSLEVDFEFGTP
jgi:hypothetical protein